MTPKDTSAPIYLFDGECILCSRAVAYMLEHEIEPVTRFVAIQSGEGRALARDHTIDPDDPESFLYIESGTPYEKSDAVFVIARRVRGPARLIRLARILPKPIRDYGYDLIAKHRYKIFGKTDSCYVPTSETRHRFVLP